MGVVLPLEYNPKAIQGRSSIIETEAQINSDFHKQFLIVMLLLQIMKMFLIKLI